jgi:hypothetical protein
MWHLGSEKPEGRTHARTALQQCTHHVRKIPANIVVESSARGEKMKKERHLGQRQKTKRNVNRNADGARLDRHTRDKVDRHLRSAYEQIVEEGIPDRFVELVKQLERRKDQEDST